MSPMPKSEEESMHITKFGLSTISLNRTCPLCGCKEGAALGKMEIAAFNDHPLANSFSIAGCKDCGFVFYNTQSNEGDFDRFYEKYYFSASYLSGQPPQWQQKKFKMIADRITPYLAGSRTPIVDVGAGTGGLLQEFASRGYKNLFGVDTSPECVDHIVKEGWNGKVGSASNLPSINAKGGILIFSEIFEHLYAPVAAIDNAARIIGEGGLVYITVPDGERYDRQGVSPFTYFIFEHINHFDTDHLIRLFVSRGFKPETMISIDHDIGEKVLWPMLHGIFCLTGSAEARPVTPQKKADFLLAHRTMHWFEDLDCRWEKLQTLAESQKPVYIWGLSYRTQLLLAMSPLRNCNIQCLIDNDPRKWGKSIAGQAVCSGEKLTCAGPDTAVVIGVGPSSLKMKDILLKDIGYQGETILLDSIMQEHISDTVN